MTEADNPELQKAKFYYSTIAKHDDFFKRTYSSVVSKIGSCITVLTTLIPILTGLGGIVFLNYISIPFFALYVISISLLVIALAKCVHLLTLEDFRHINTKEILIHFRDKPLEFGIFKIASTWQEKITRNLSIINLMNHDLKVIVKLIIIGLSFLVAAFVVLAAQWYLLGYIEEPTTSVLLILPELC